MGLSIELWLHGASAAVLPLVRTTLASYAIRSQNLLAWPRDRVGKRLDICTHLPHSARRGVDRGEMNRPTGSCMALKWLSYGWLSARAIANDTVRMRLEAAVDAFLRRVEDAEPYVGARGSTATVAGHCVGWSPQNCSQQGNRTVCDEPYERIAPIRHVVPTVRV